MTDAIADRILAELLVLRRLVERLSPPPLSPPQRELLDALDLVVGRAVFTSAEALELAQIHLGDRPRLAAALGTLGVKDAHRLGMVLAELVKRSKTLDVRLVRAGAESGSGMWAVESGPLGA